MAEHIVLAYDVQTGAAEREVKEFSKTVEAESRKAQSSASGIARNVETQTASMSQSFKGAGSAIAATNATLQLLGTRGPPALQTLASSAASLVASGFGPMGLALAGATGLISLITAFATESEEAADSLDSGLSVSLEKGKKRAEELRLELIRLRDEMNAAKTGRSVGAVTSEREVAQLKEEFNDVKRAIELIQQLRLYEGRARDPSNTQARNEAELAAWAARRSLNRLKAGADEGSTLASIDYSRPGLFSSTENAYRETENALLDRLGTLSKIISREIEAQTRKDEVGMAKEVQSRLAPPGTELPRPPYRRMVGFGPDGPIYEDSFAPPMGTPFGQSTLSQRESSARSFLQADIAYRDEIDRLRAEIESDRRARSEEDYKFRTTPFKTSAEEMERELAVVKALGIEQARAKQEAELAVIESNARQQAGAYASSLSGALQQLLSGGGLAGFFASFANATADAVTGALARALVQASGVENALQGLFRNLGSAIVGANYGFGSGSSVSPQFPEGFSGADLIVDNFKGASARGPEQIVVVMAPDESVADAMANKISSGGALAIVARAQGRGVMAGRLGPRRG